MPRSTALALHTRAVPHPVSHPLAQTVWSLLYLYRHPAQMRSCFSVACLSRHVKDRLSPSKRASLAIEGPHKRCGNRADVEAVRLYPVVVKVEEDGFCSLSDLAVWAHVTRPSLKNC